MKIDVGTWCWVTLFDGEEVEAEVVEVKRMLLPFLSPRYVVQVVTGTFAGQRLEVGRDKIYVEGKYDTEH